MFYDAECGLSWWVLHDNFSRLCILLLLSEVVYRCQSYPLGVVQVNYILTDFLLVETVHFWYKCDKLYNNNSGFIYIPLQFYQVFSSCILTLVLGAYLLKIVIFFENESLYHYLMPCLSLITILTLKFELSKIGIDTPTFFWLLSVCYIFSHPFTFNLYISV